MRLLFSSVLLLLATQVVAVVDRDATRGIRLERIMFETTTCSPSFLFRWRV